MRRTNCKYKTNQKKKERKKNCRHSEYFIWFLNSFCFFFFLVLYTEIFNCIVKKSKSLTFFIHREWKRAELHNWIVFWYFYSTAFLLLFFFVFLFVFFLFSWRKNGVAYSEHFTMNNEKALLYCLIVVYTY